MAETRPCPNCVTALPANAWQGLCLRCVVRVSLTTAMEVPPLDAAPPQPPLETQNPKSKTEHPWPCRFGDYELLEEIARGGMGMVYKARQISLNRTVAVKFLLGGALASPEFVRRFRREAETVANLHHPHIVAVHEIGEADGQLFFSMDLVAGKNLAEWVRERPLPGRRAATYLKSIAEAIQYAHANDVLHRDLKPSNILIDEHDQPRITDFGLAKRLAGRSDLTVTGQMLGSPSYLPPEQLSAKAGRVNARSDFYSLGAILYHLLTGRPPFLAEGIEETLLQVLDAEPVGLRLFNPSVPVDLETICLNCLEKDPARRYASAQDLADDLGRFLGGEPTLARPVSAAGKLRRWCKRKPMVAGWALLSLNLLATIVIITVMANVRLAEKEAIVRQNAYVADMHLVAQALEANNLGRAIELLERHRRPSTLNQQPSTDLRGWEWRYFWKQCQSEELFTLGSHGSSVLSFAFSPDGTRLASGSFDGEVKLWDLASRREIASGRHAARVNALAFSPDGQTLASGGEDRFVRLWDARSLQAVGERLSHSEDIRAVAFSSDGQQLRTASLDSFRVWDFATGRELARQPLPTWQRAAISPDGQFVALGQPDGTVVLWSVSSNSAFATLSGHSNYVLPVVFSADGKMLPSRSIPWPRADADAHARRALKRTMPGTGPPSPDFEASPTAALSLHTRAGSHLPTFDHPGAVQPSGCFQHLLGRYAGVKTTRAARSVIRHRVCLLLSELRPRLAQSSAEQSDRPAAADGRVCCAPAQTRERALRTPSRDLSGGAGARPQEPDFRPEPARPLRFRGRSAGYATASLCSRHGSIGRQARHRCASTANSTAATMLVPARLCLRRIRRPRFAERDSRRRVSKATPAAERAPAPKGGCRLRLPAADCDPIRSSYDAHSCASGPSRIVRVEDAASREGEIRKRQHS